MKYGSLKAYIVIIFSIVILIVGILGYKFFWNKAEPENIQVPAVKTLTQKEKLDILSQVSTTTAIKNSLSDSQKSDILNKVSTTTKVQEMTYEEKLKILNATQ